MLAAQDVAAVVPAAIQVCQAVSRLGLLMGRQTAEAAWVLDAKGILLSYLRGCNVAT
jgi:hypothetical protein